MKSDNFTSSYDKNINVESTKKDFLINLNLSPVTSYCDEGLITTNSTQIDRSFLETNIEIVHMEPSTPSNLIENSAIFKIVPSTSTCAIKDTEISQISGIEPLSCNSANGTEIPRHKNIKPIDEISIESKETHYVTLQESIENNSIEDIGSPTNIIYASTSTNSPKYVGETKDMLVKSSCSNINIVNNYVTASSDASIIDSTHN